jgi:hypothetical protein
MMMVALLCSRRMYEALLFLFLFLFFVCVKQFTAHGGGFSFCFFCLLVLELFLAVLLFCFSPSIFSSFLCCRCFSNAALCMSELFLLFLNALCPSVRGGHVAQPKFWCWWLLFVSLFVFQLSAQWVAAESPLGLYPSVWCFQFLSLQRHTRTQTHTHTKQKKEREKKRRQTCFSSSSLSSRLRSLRTCLRNEKREVSWRRQRGERRCSRHGARPQVLLSTKKRKGDLFRLLSCFFFLLLQSFTFNCASRGGGEKHATS